MISAYEYALSKLKPVPDELRDEAKTILLEESFEDFLDYLVEKHLMPADKFLYSYLNTEIRDYEPYDNYNELNEKKYIQFLEKINLP